MTVGPWKPISLELYQNRIIDLDVRCKISEVLDSKLLASVTYISSPGYVSCIIRDADGKVEATSDKLSTSSGRSDVAFDFASGSIKLWYPVGYGKQPLYTVEVQITDQVGTHISKLLFANLFYSKAIYWILHPRRLRFVVFVWLKKNSKMKTASHSCLKSTTSGFFVEVHIYICLGVRISQVISGSNWIPADSFLTTQDFFLFA